MKARHDTAIRFLSTYAIALAARKSRYLPRLSEDDANKLRPVTTQRWEPHSTNTVINTDASSHRDTGHGVRFAAQKSKTFS